MNEDTKSALIAGATLVAFTALGVLAGWLAVAVLTIMSLVAALGIQCGK